MDDEVNDILNMDQAAAFLNMAKSSLYVLAQKGKVPCQKMGRRWMFSRVALELYAAGLTSKEVQDYIREATLEKVRERLAEKSKRLGE